MQDIDAMLDRLADETLFSGVIRADVEGSTVVERAHGFADRSHGIANTVGTQFGIASGTKGLTALTIMSLIEDGRLELATTARSILRDDLSMIGSYITVEHLLAHRSGIGDYLDEDAGGEITDYVMPVPVHELSTTEDYLRVLDGHPSKFEPNEQFSYCNSGYVVLALIAERVSGTPFHDLVSDQVCIRAGMGSTSFLRSDELPGNAARGYLSTNGLRTNVLHLPVRGSGDGGAYSTVANIHALWEALFDGRIVSRACVTEMIHPRTRDSSGVGRYGLGFWLRGQGSAIFLEGMDAGVSFRSMHDPVAQRTISVISNTSKGAWPIARLLESCFMPDAKDGHRSAASNNSG